jgi:hypothetical protein
MRGPTASAVGVTVYCDGWARRDVVRDDMVMTDDDILATDCDDRNAVRANIVGATKSVVIGRRVGLGTKKRVSGLRTPGPSRRPRLRPDTAVGVTCHQTRKL